MKKRVENQTDIRTLHHDDENWKDVAVSNIKTIQGDIKKRKKLFIQQAMYGYWLHAL